MHLTQVDVCRNRPLTCPFCTLSIIFSAYLAQLWRLEGGRKGSGQVKGWISEKSPRRKWNVIAESQICKQKIQMLLEGIKNSELLLNNLKKYYTYIPLFVSDSDETRHITFYYLLIEPILFQKHFLCPRCLHFFVNRNIFLI